MCAPVPTSLGQYVEHGEQVQRSNGGPIACFGRQVVRNAGEGDCHSWLSSWFQRFQELLAGVKDSRGADGRVAYGSTHWKFASSVTLPTPLHLATAGYGHSGLVSSTRLFLTRCAVILSGAFLASTHRSSPASQFT